MYSIYHDLTLSLLSVDPLFLADIYHIEFQVFCGSALVGLVHSCVLREHLVIDDTCTKWLICCPGIPSPDLSACVEKLLGKGAWRILASPLTGPWDWPASSIRTGDFHWLLLPMGFFFFFSLLPRSDSSLTPSSITSNWKVAEGSTTLEEVIQIQALVSKKCLLILVKKPLSLCVFEKYHFLPLTYTWHTVDA